MLSKPLGKGARALELFEAVSAAAAVDETPRREGEDRGDETHGPQMTALELTRARGTEAGKSTFGARVPRTARGAKGDETPRPRERLKSASRMKY